MLCDQSGSIGLNFTVNAAHLSKLSLSNLSFQTCNEKQLQTC